MIYQHLYKNKKNKFLFYYKMYPTQRSKQKSKQRSKRIYKKRRNFHGTINRKSCRRGTK
jgi:hypothetical protein